MPRARGAAACAHGRAQYLRNQDDEAGTDRRVVRRTTDPAAIVNISHSGVSTTMVAGWRPDSSI